MIRARGPRGLQARDTPAASFLVPGAPEQAGSRLDVSLNGQRRSSLFITPTSVRSRFEGGVQGPSFWLQSKSAGYNPMERRLEGELLPCGGATEVRAELRTRPSAAVVVGSAVLTLGLLSVLLVPLALLVDSIPLVGEAGRTAILVMVAGLWALLGVTLYGLRRLGRDGERRAVRFLAGVLDAPDRDLLGL